MKKIFEELTKYAPCWSNNFQRLWDRTQITDE